MRHAVEPGSCFVRDVAAVRRELRRGSVGCELDCVIQLAGLQRNRLDVLIRPANAVNALIATVAPRMAAYLAERNG